MTFTLNELRRKGFHRLYVNGRTVTIDDLSPADLRDQSTLKVIIDRVKLDGDMRGRLTDSIEMAYREAGGTAFAIEDNGCMGATGAVTGATHRCNGATVRRRTCSASGSSARTAT